MSVKSDEKATSVSGGKPGALENRHDLTGEASCLGGGTPPRRLNLTPG